MPSTRKRNKRVWYPKELTLQSNNVLVELYKDASSETSDVVFSVGETVYRAHKSILALRGKKLYEIANECDNIDRPIPILSMREEIFKSILDFIYTVKTPEIENEGIATELLVAADRYDCIHLKLYVESIIVDKFLTAGNAAALLIFADSHSCALLKEAATNVFVTDPTTVKKAEAWSEITESRRLLEELLDSVTRSDKSSVMEKVPTIELDHLDLITLIREKLDQFNVTDFRKILEHVNLELDGSREVIIDRLATHLIDYPHSLELI